MRMSVVFPAPLGPSRAWISPTSMLIETFLSTTFSAKRCDTSCASRTARGGFGELEEASSRNDLDTHALFKRRRYHCERKAWTTARFRAQI